MENEIKGKKSRVKKIIFFVVLFLITAWFVAILIVILTSGYRSSDDRDIRRINDLRQITLALEMFYDDNKILPENLDKIEVQQYMTSVPEDRATKQPYEYLLIDNNSALLKANLYNKKMRALENDIDGIIAGINCDDPAYCIIFEAEK